MRARPTMLIAIGAAVFVLGAAIVVLALHGKGKASAAPVAAAQAPAEAPVVVVTKQEPAGTTGEAMIEDHAVTLTVVSPSAWRSDDLTSLDALGQEALDESLAAGQAVEASNLRLDVGSLTPPAGDESISVTLPSGAAGMAGYLSAGDKVDVYANVTKVSIPTPAGTSAMPIPCVALVQSSIEVLDTSVQVPSERSSPSASGRQVPGSLTVLLAVTPVQARQIIFYTSNESLYLTASAANEKPVSTSVCSGYAANPQLSPAS